MTSIKLYILLAIIFHGGGTDANGGHYNRSTGEYHYHHGHRAHSHANGCPYGSGGSSGGGYVWEITPNDSIILWIIRIFTVIFILGVAYVFIGGFYYSIKLKIKKRREAEQKIIDEKERIKTLVKSWKKDRNDKETSLETRIKKAINAYSDGRIKEKYYVAFKIGSLYKDLGKLKKYNTKESRESVKWINIGKDLFTDFIKRNKKINNTELKLRVKINEFFYVRAQAYALFDKYNALLDYNYIIDNLEHTVDVYFERALLKKELNSYQSALEDVNHFLSKTKTYEGYNLRAILLYILAPSKFVKNAKIVRDVNLVNQSIKNYENSIALNRKQTIAYKEKAHLEETNNFDLDKAIKTINDGLKVNKDNPELIYSLILLYKKSNYDKTLDLLEKLFQYEPDFSPFLYEPEEENKYFGYAYFVRSEIYRIKKNYNAERNDLRSALMYRNRSAILRYLDITGLNYEQK